MKKKLLSLLLALCLARETNIFMILLVTFAKQKGGL